MVLVQPLIVPFVPTNKVNTVGPGPFPRHASRLEYGAKGEDDSFPNHSAAIDGIHVLIWVELLLYEYSSEGNKNTKSEIM